MSSMPRRYPKSHRPGVDRLAVAMAAVGVGVIAGSRLRRWPSRAICGVLVLDVVCNAAQARTIVARALRAAAEREREQQDLAAARLGRALGAAHQPLSSAQPHLRALLAVQPAGPWGAPATLALQRLELLGQLLDESRPLREALADDTGRLPVVGGHAARVPLRDGDPLKLYGAADAIPAALPRRAQRGLRQIGLVLDEVRLLHSAEIERTILIYTLVSRAALVCLAPLLGAWSAAPAPVAATGPIGDLVWAAMAAASLATAVRAPAIVEGVMEDSAAGARLRSRLLRVEVPLTAAGLVLCPAWTVVVFATGSTNWWQRQTLGLEFSWRKFGAFVVAVVGLQQVGLAHAGVPLGSAAGETALALLALFVTGGSYGAMLPLAIATGMAVVIGDSRRSLSAARRARDELLSCARALEATADSLRSISPDAPVAARAASTARQAAHQLERSADLLGRRGLFASQVLAELADEAVVRSYLPRSGSPALERLRLAAEDAGEAPPANAGEPIWTPSTLRHARLNSQTDARKVRAALEWALNESHRHGTASVRVLFAVENERLVMRVGNRMRPVEHQQPGLASEGDREFQRVVRRLPNGHPEHRGVASPSELGLSAGPDWYVVRASWSAKGLEFSP